MARTNKSKQSEHLRKMQPKLRMFCNGDTEVNMLRAGQCASIKFTGKKPPKPVGSIEQIAFTTITDAMSLPTQKERGSLKQTSKDASVSVFVETVDGGTTAGLKGLRSRQGNLATATVRLADLAAMAKSPNVAFIEVGESLAAPQPIIASDTPSEPSTKERAVESTVSHQNGSGVIIGIIDVGGFDFSHPDFLDAKRQTRFKVIWDQGGKGGSPARDPRFKYGREITDTMMNQALKSATNVAVPAYELEPQSQMSEQSHATHVASIAAGNRGVCGKADIVGVLIALSDDDVDRRRSFYDSTRIVDAIEYLLDYADAKGKPISINISLGTNGSAHDGSNALSRWIDSALSKRGRSVCVAAGNAGQDLPEHDQDIGHWLGRIHTRGVIASPGLTSDIQWRVVGNDDRDVSENELEIWYAAQDRIGVSLRTPEGEWIGPVEPGEYVENKMINNGTIVSIYNEVYHPANGANYVSIYLSPFLSTTKVVGVRAGDWTVRLHGREVRNGRYDGWIERDDPRPRGRVGTKEFWNFPSYFAGSSNIDDSSISSLACGHRVVSVGNLDYVRERINSSSSQGPTRDGRTKPDIAAPGTDIVAANGFASPDDLWVQMTGTSMASPYVAGIIGLMFAVEPHLTAAQIEGILHRTSMPLPGADYAWSNAAGFGRINAVACLKEVSTINLRVDKTK